MRIYAAQIVSHPSHVALKAAHTGRMPQISGVIGIHSCGKVHCDLKPENLLLNAKGHIKIGDLGLARRLVPKGVKHDYGDPAPWRLLQVVGTLSCMAPEMIKNWPYYFPADVWGIGLILWWMIFGRVSRVLDFASMSLQAPRLSATHPVHAKGLRRSHQGEDQKLLRRERPER